jgi:hypothetical protein
LSSQLENTIPAKYKLVDLIGSNYTHRIGLLTDSDWALLGQALMCMPLLQELDLSGLWIAMSEHQNSN